MTDSLVRIQGAGPVGMMLALFLAQAGWPKNRIELIDPAVDGPNAVHVNDPRVLAISHGSLLRLSQLGIEHDATPIKQIHVSAEGHFGIMEIKTDRVGVSQLGALMGYGDLFSRLREKMSTEGIRLKPSSDGSASPDVTVIAEGGLYQSADERGPYTRRDYNQRALIGWVETATPPSDTAYERFTEDGALALLPIKDRYALIWCCSPDRAAIFSSASEARQKEMIQTVMGGRISGLASVSLTGSYPLGMKWRDTIAEGRTVWIGNAAQTLHPIAGQGMNLGFRDAEALATCLQQHGQSMTERLADYARRRKTDRWAVRTATDTLARQGWVRRAIGGLAFVPGAKKMLGQVLMYGG
jgi:2-octaprenyl-6-methoxyphenol hydroxylase